MAWINNLWRFAVMACEKMLFSGSRRAWSQINVCELWHDMKMLVWKSDGGNLWRKILPVRSMVRLTNDLQGKVAPPSHRVCCGEIHGHFTCWKGKHASKTLSALNFCPWNDDNSRGKARTRPPRHMVWKFDHIWRQFLQSWRVKLPQTHKPLPDHWCKL
jgi:hypothetical protein